MAYGRRLRLPEGRWISKSTTSDGLPSSRLTTLRIDVAVGRLGTAAQGLAVLRPPLPPTAPPPPPGTEPPGGAPTATPEPELGEYGYVLRLRTTLYLPIMHRGASGGLIVLDPLEP